MDVKPLKILVSGASGSIGRVLVPSLQKHGHRVSRLVRGKASGPDQVVWDPASPLRPHVVSGFDAVIHLAGESIASRWTAEKKRRISESRLQGTRHLCEALAEAEAKPHVLVSGSAIGYYGDRGEETLTEHSESGSGFLAGVCREWEVATKAADYVGIRTMQIRTSLVLNTAGGALPKMLTPFRLGIGGNMGDGRQWWSWIHVHDLVLGIQLLLNNDSFHGPVNVASPHPVRNAEFTQILASVLHRPAIFPMPAFAARFVFGEMANELLLSSQRVEPVKLVEGKYSFHHPELRGALEDLLKSK